MRLITTEAELDTLWSTLPVGETIQDDFRIKSLGTSLRAIVNDGRGRVKHE